MDRLNPDIEKLVRAKEVRRAKLAALPFHEKVRTIVLMQQMAAPILRARGKPARVWELQNGEGEDPPEHGQSFRNMS